MAQGIQGNENKTWLCIDGTLDPIDFNGPSFFRFPLELAEIVLNRFCPESGSVLDPFVGFGTTLKAAAGTGRWGFGFEHDLQRYEFASKTIRAPSRIIFDSIQNASNYDLPDFDLIFTSPPYSSFRGPQKDPVETYLADLEIIFKNLRRRMRASGKLVLEISNIKSENGVVPLAFMAAERLSKHYRFVGEWVRCNTGIEIAGPGYDHSYLLEFGLK